MPTISAPAKILVTGANGFLGVWTVKAFLDKGYTVVGTVRSESKTAHLKKIFKEYGDKLQLAVVEDITAGGAFDELVRDVDGIAHTASPYHYAAEDPKELLDPAIKGTLSILKSALKKGKKVKRVVVTSSGAAIRATLPEPKVFTEEDWNDGSVEEVKKKGKDASNMDKYMASKSLAERAAWDFMKENKSQLQWDLTCLNPTFIFGPILQDVSKPSDMNTSSKMLYDTFTTSSKLSEQELLQPRGGWIDVRDIAEAHVLALEKEAAGGERIIISNGKLVYQDFLDTANALSPPINRDLPKGSAGAGKSVTQRVVYSNEKMKKIIGLGPTSIEKLTRDILEDFEQRGW